MPERNYPQHPMMDIPVIKDSLYKIGLITHESKIAGETDRPLALKMNRADFYKEYFKTQDREERKAILEKANELDRMFVQFLENQKEITVNVGDLGEQKARYVVLEPKHESNKPPIVLLPGISNDLEGIGELPIKLAASGRKVVEIAYPESWHGSVTEKFGDAVRRSNTFEPHTVFFENAINEIVGEYGQIDLWGVSTGALITTNLLKDDGFKNRIDNATLLVPPGEINHKNFNLAMFRELIASAKKIWLTSKSSVSNSKIINTSDEHRRLMLHTHEALKEKVIKEFPWWENNLTTGGGNKTVVVIGEQDYITEAKRKKDLIEANDTVDLISIKTGTHSTPAIKSEMVIDLVNNLQNKNK